MHNEGWRRGLAIRNSRPLRSYYTHTPSLPPFGVCIYLSCIIQSVSEGKGIHRSHNKSGKRVRLNSEFAMSAWTRWCVSINPIYDRYFQELISWILISEVYLRTKNLYNWQGLTFEDLCCVIKYNMFVCHLTKRTNQSTNIMLCLCIIFCIHEIFLFIIRLLISFSKKLWLQFLKFWLIF